MTAATAMVGANLSRGVEMKVTVEIDCSPAEGPGLLRAARRHQLNDHLVNEMTKRVDANINMLQPRSC